MPIEFRLARARLRRAAAGPGALQRTPAHACRRGRRTASPITSGEAPRLPWVEQAAPIQQGRPYPPPPAREPVWPAQLTILAAIGAAAGAARAADASARTVLIPSLEAVLLVGLFFATPRELEHEHRRRRQFALG